MHAMILDLFGLQGRIGRFGWWMTQLTLAAVSFLYGMFLGEPPVRPDIAEPRSVEEAFAIVSEAMATPFRDPVVVGLQVLSLWLFLTTSVQRLHDRGNSGWRVLFAFAPTALFAYAAYIYMTTGTLLAMVVVAGFAGTLVSAVWILIEFGMLRGDDGDNEYGPPPGEESRRSALREELDAMGEAYVHSSVDETPAYPVAMPPGRLFGRQ
jgi:uncharacterized membrane protein YhaH (DUF805 family)